jgi:hypothetical protein
MARGVARAAGRAPISSSLDGGSDWRYERLPGWLAPPLSWSSLILFLALQIA